MSPTKLEASSVSFCRGFVEERLHSLKTMQANGWLKASPSCLQDSLPLTLFWGFFAPEKQDAIGAHGSPCFHGLIVHDPSLLREGGEDAESSGAPKLGDFYPHG